MTIPLLSEHAISILRRNDHGGYTVPTHGLYPYQWNWDSAFVALGFAEFDRDRAWVELETLVSGQWDDGMIPQIIFHQDDPGYFPGPAVWATGRTPPTSGITQPPVLASIVRHLWQAEGADPAHPRMRALVAACLKSHRWFHTYRDPLANGLVMVTHNWETGRDNSSEWDEALDRVDTSRVGSYQRRDTAHVDAAMRPTAREYDRYVAILQFGRACGWDHREIADHGPFRMIDVGMSMELLRANRDLLVMVQAIGDSATADELKARIALSEHGVDWLWNEDAGAYCSRDLGTGQSSGLVTNASFLAFYAGVGNAAQHARLIAALGRLTHSARFLLPSLEAGSRAYDHQRYWRGPIWLVVSYMVALGLAETGHQAWADRIRSDSAGLIELSGFYESFSPETGAGSGGPDFSWTAAMWLAWCGKVASP
ncbi:MGH1-like glycoside hydrolase domain-containing protein [Novosphingobium acidiphilum]|uniref:MGH1-like glycoside hydrolase domain-containing protein n=1 Tax=Novosphingobium acidiphilum TaxID=505248 RepID=UPI00048EAFCF|nr:trehalase family glycosidase [Novosphingobium acidiphilum]